MPLGPTSAWPSRPRKSRAWVPKSAASTRTATSSSGRKAEIVALPWSSVVEETRSARVEGTARSSRESRRGTIRTPATGRPAGPATTNSERAGEPRVSRTGKPASAEGSSGAEAATDPARYAQRVGRSQRQMGVERTRENRPSASAFALPRSAGGSLSQSPPAAINSRASGPAGRPGPTTRPDTRPAPASSDPAPTVAIKRRRTNAVATISGLPDSPPGEHRSTIVDGDSPRGPANRMLLTGAAGGPWKGTRPPEKILASTREEGSGKPTPWKELREISPLLRGKIIAHRKNIGGASRSGQGKTAGNAWPGRGQANCVNWEERTD